MRHAFRYLQRCICRSDPEFDPFHNPCPYCEQRIDAAEDERDHR